MSEWAEPTVDYGRDQEGLIRILKGVSMPTPLEDFETILDYLCVDAAWWSDPEIQSKISRIRAILEEEERRKDKLPYEDRDE